jgi:hypothetical protein
LKQFLGYALSRLQNAWYRRGYYLPNFLRPTIPPPVFEIIPDGFTVHRIADTGVIAVDNFCTDEEAAYLIAKAKDQLKSSTVVDTRYDSLVENVHRKSADAGVYSMQDRDPRAFPLVVRAAMLLGLPTDHAENIPVTYYNQGGYFREHMDAFDSFYGDRHYTVLIYLNEPGPEGGGETVFPELNIYSRPVKRRAVIWRNYKLDGSINELSKHAALTLADGAEKWVVQIGFRRYSMFKGPTRTTELAIQPLKGNEALPAGLEFRRKT